MELKDNEKCFVCGKKNAVGLNVDFTFNFENRTSRGIFRPRPEHEGYKGIVHGGIIASLMDEAMVKLAWKLGLNAVSAEIKIRFKTMMHSGETVEVSGRIIDSDHRLIRAEAEVRRGSALIAEATGKLLKI